MQRTYNANQQANTKATTALTLGKYSAAMYQFVITGLVSAVVALIIYLFSVEPLYCVVLFLIGVIFGLIILVLDIRAVESREVEIDDKLIKEEQRQNAHLRAMDIAKQESDLQLELARIHEREGAQRILIALAKSRPDLAAAITSAMRPLAEPTEAAPLQLEGRPVKARLTGGILSPVFDYNKMRDMLIAQTQFGTSRAVKTVDGQARAYTHDNNVESELKKIALKMSNTPLVKEGNVYKILPGRDVNSVVSWLDNQVIDV